MLVLNNIFSKVVQNIISKALLTCKIILLIFILLYPQEMLSASRNGLMLWFNNVLPVLLPFIVIVNFLAAFGFIQMVARWVSPLMKHIFKLPGAGGFAIICGLISGYPMGAKTVADLHRDGEINLKEAQRLLAFCNNAGPLFIVGVVGVAFLGNAAAGYVLWGGHVGAAIFMGIVTGWFSKYDGQTGGKRASSKAMPKPPIGKALGESVKNAMEALVVVGGLIIFFSVVTKVVVMHVGDVPFIGVIAGAIEITNGVKLLADASVGVISPSLMAAVGGVVAFGGLSVHAQALHFTAGTGIKGGIYILHKLLHGIIAAGMTWVFWSLYS